ncbi:MAG: PA14 domain-containing protein [Rhodospirillales bacterium]
MADQPSSRGIAKTMISRRSISYFFAACTVVVGSAALAADSPKTFTGLTPVSPQPAADKIDTGLGVIYYQNYFKKLDEITKLGKGKPGRPIPVLDHKTQDGNVLTASAAMGVGAKITGLIKFDKPGKYVMQMNSNDGARVTIAGKKILEDDGIHGDEMSDPVELTIDQTGWYDIAVDYFQRKGTSALQLFWTPPGGSQAIVPAANYAHMKP